MKNQIEDQVKKIQKGQSKEYESDLNESLLVMEQIAGKIWAQSTMRSRHVGSPIDLSGSVNQDTVALFVTAKQRYRSKGCWLMQSRSQAC